MSYMLRYKTDPPGLFASEASNLFHLLSKWRVFKNKGSYRIQQTCNINHQQLFVCYLQRIIPLKSTIKRSGYGNMCSGGGVWVPLCAAWSLLKYLTGAEWNGIPAWLHCILSVPDLLWQQKLPAEPCRQVRGLVQCGILDRLQALGQESLRRQCWENSESSLRYIYKQTSTNAERKQAVLDWPEN